MKNLIKQYDSNKKAFITVPAVIHSGGYLTFFNTDNGNYEDGKLYSINTFSFCPLLDLTLLIDHWIYENGFHATYESDSYMVLKNENCMIKINKTGLKITIEFLY